MIRAFIIQISLITSLVQTCFGQDFELPNKLEFYVGSNCAYFGKIGLIRSFSEVTSSITFSVTKTLKGEKIEEFNLEIPVPGIDKREYYDPRYNLNEGDQVIIVDPEITRKQTNYFVAYKWRSIIPLKSKSFAIDSSLLSLFNGNNISMYIDKEFFKGHILNNKPNGKWKEYSDSGEYILGKRIGNWLINGKSVFYDNPILNTNLIEIYNDTIVQHYKNSKIMKCNGVLLRTWKYHQASNKIVIKKYCSGKLYQKAVFDKYFQLKKIVFWKNKGRCLRKKSDDIERIISMVDYFYYDELKSE
jgi:hypothetical protein